MASEVSDEKKREIYEVAKGRVKCEKAALDVVVKLVESERVGAEELKSATSSITPDHYEDIVEERSISNLCGYPLCARTLGDVPRQKYHISLLRKQVFEITERKKFCSALCYKASKFYSSQISTTPLWMRETESKKEIKLLDFTSLEQKTPLSSNATDTSQSADYNSTDSKEDSVAISRNLLSSGSVSSTPSNTKEVMVQNSQGADSQSKDHSPPLTTSNIVQHVASECTSTVTKGPGPGHLEGPASTTLDRSMHHSCNMSREDTKSWSEGKQQQVVKPMKAMIKSTAPTTVTKLYHILSEWCTPATQWMLGEGWDERERSGVDHSNARLVESQRTEENRKVTAVSKDKDFAYKSDNLMKEVKVMEREQDSLQVPTMPAVDHSSQRLIRRRIVLQKILPLVQTLTKMQLHQYSSDMTSLVKTLRLRADNISLCPVEWFIVAIVFLHCLSSRNPTVAGVLKEQAFLDHQTRLQLTEDMLRPMVTIFVTANFQYCTK